MALEAIEDGSGDGDEDLANVFQQNKRYVTDVEVASIMGGHITGTKDTCVVTSTDKPQPGKDKTIVMTSTPIKMQKFGGVTRRQQMSDTETVKKPSKRDRDEAVDTSHSLSMSQLMKVFNQPQKFMVPKVADAYSQKEADAYSQKEADAYCQKEADAYSQKEADAYNQKEADTCNQKEADTCSQKEADTYSQKEADAYNQKEADTCSQKKADAYSQKDGGHYNDETDEEEFQAEASEGTLMECSSYTEPKPITAVDDKSERVEKERTVASVTSHHKSEHLNQERAVASVILVDKSEHLEQDLTFASVEDSNPMMQRKTSLESQTKTKGNNSESRQPKAELDEDTFVDVEPNIGDRELNLHNSFHELETESSTDNTLKGADEYADDSSSNGEEECSNLDAKLKSQFGVLDEESVTDDVTTSHDSHHRFLFRIPSIVVISVDGELLTEGCVEDDACAEGAQDSMAEETEPNVVQATSYTDANFMNVLQGIMLPGDNDGDRDIEEDEGAETDNHDVAEMVEGSQQQEVVHNRTAVKETQDDNVMEEKSNVVLIKQIQASAEEGMETGKKDYAINSSEIQTVNIMKVEEDDQTLVDNTDNEQQSASAKMEIQVADGQFNQSSLTFVDERDSTRYSKEAVDNIDNEIDGLDGRTEENAAEDEKSVEDTETNVRQSPVSVDTGFASVLQGIMSNDDRGSDEDTDKRGQYVTLKEVEMTMEEKKKKDDDTSDAELEMATQVEEGDKPEVDDIGKEEENDSVEKTTDEVTSADKQVKQTSLASPDVTLSATRCSNLEIFLSRGHSPDPVDQVLVEGANTAIGGQPTLLSLASQLTATLVKGIGPESDPASASLHATSPPTETLPAQSSPLATETPTEESRHNGRLSSSLKSTTQESDDYSYTGCNAELDIAVTPSGNDTRPRSPSSIPSPAMMRSKRTLEGVCELDEDRQSSDSYPVTPRTDSPSSTSSHYSRGQHSNRSTNLLTPFSVSTESMMSYYSDAGEGNYGKIPVTGEILFGLDYNYKNSVFEVTIRQCKDIATVDAKKKRSDPYVKTYLLPDRTKNGKRKTRVKKHTLNPVFDEILKYQVTKSELETRTLWVTVWHNDTFGRNDFLGEVTLPLDYYEFGDSSAQWYKLQERNPLPLSLLTYKGDLNLSLMFVSPENLPGRKKDGRCGSNGSLHVLIKQARNLTAVRANGSSDPFCKGYLLPDKVRRIKQKTSVLKKNCNPTWNHKMVFDNVSWDELRDYCLELTIWDYDRFTSNDFLGGVRLNLGTGKSGGSEVDWMDAKGDEISIWQAMLDRPNYWIDGTLMVRPNMDRRK